MSNIQFPEGASKPKSFWKKPEGVTGAVFLAAIIGGLGFLATTIDWVNLAQNMFALVGTIAALGVVAFMVLDPKMRNLVWYMYKSVMRTITGWFVQIDPVGILKSYVDDLKDNLGKMSKQIGVLKGQMRKLKTLIATNQAEIDKNMKIASAAKKQGNDKQVMLSSRKAARMTETNAKYTALTNRMEVMYRILDKMYQNSEVLLEDTKDQVSMKEQERKAIRTSHSAMQSAMSVMSGDPDKRAMFDMAMENIADDVANKVGEMERFMDMSASFMDSVDLQNGIFEEEGLKMLEKWEKESTLMLLGDGKTAGSLDLNSPTAEPQKRSSGNSNYDQMFE